MYVGSAKDDAQRTVRGEVLSFARQLNGIFNPTVVHGAKTSALGRVGGTRNTDEQCDGGEIGAGHLAGDKRQIQGRCAALSRNALVDGWVNGLAHITELLVPFFKMCDKR